MGGLRFHHGCQMVARLKQSRDDVRINHQQTAADSLQNGLDSIGELGNGLEPHHPGSTLDAMGSAECPVKVRTVGLTPLQIHQPLFESDEKLARFLEEHLTESVVRAAAQLPSPQAESGSTW
jgi:hypothetical protein